MPSDPEAHADTGVTTPARALRSSPTAAAAALGMYFCTASGDTALKPRARMSSYAKTSSSVDPIPVPIDTINRLESTSGDPALPHTRRLNTVDIFCRYDNLRSSTLVSSWSKSSSRCPPIRTGRSYCSTNESASLRIPLCPSSNFFHVLSAPVARAVVIATALTTTLGKPFPVDNRVILRDSLRSSVLPEGESYVVATEAE